MSGANPLRGEVPLGLADGEVRLRPDFSALVAAEAEIGNLFTLLERAGAGEVRLAEIAALFWHCSGAVGARGDFEARLAAGGLAALLPAYRMLLARMFGGA